jgi:predicted amidohydrolase
MFMGPSTLFDRCGQVVFIYGKLYPVWQDECQKHPPARPRDAARVYQADFGRIGFATCFDVNWTSPWQQLYNHGG